jgi:protein-disulfide isomerase
MHQELFQHQKELAELDLSHLDLTLGLEIYQFETGRSRQRHRLRIRADYEGGLRSGVKATPTLFMNGRRYDGPINAKAIIATSLSLLH